MAARRMKGSSIWRRASFCGKRHSRVIAAIRVGLVDWILDDAAEDGDACSGLVIERQDSGVVDHGPASERAGLVGEAGECRQVAWQPPIELLFVQDVEHRLARFLACTLVPGDLSA